MGKTRLAPILTLAIVALGLIFLEQQRAAAQGENLLVNAGFEGDYAAYTPETPQEQADCPAGICNTAQIPAGWKPWWLKEDPTDVNPEYKAATRNVDGNRVRTGDRAAQYFSFWKTHKAGLRQTVSVPENAVLQFSIWGHAWIAEADAPLISDRSGTPNMRIGIDPTGGTSPYGPDIIWSPFLQPYDSYQPFSVEAQAAGSQVTVFTFADPSNNPNNPEFGFKHTDIYWDDASLVIVGAGSAPPAPAPAPSNSAAPAPAVAPVPFVPGPTPTPNAEGIIYAEVLAGDSLWALAARSGITLDQILEYNNLSRDDFIREGELLIVGYGDPPSADDQNEGEVVEEAEADPSAALAGGSTDEGDKPTPTPEPEPEVVSEQVDAVAQVIQEDPGGIDICLAAFDDTNRNAIHDSGEGLRESVAFTISDGQSVVTNYITDGESEPFCVQGLPGGTYRISRSVGGNEVLTTAGDHSVSLTEGSSITLEFGSVIDAEAIAQAAAGESDSGLALENQIGTDPGNGDGASGLVVGAVVVAVLLLVGVLIIILTTRRSTAR